MLQLKALPLEIHHMDFGSEDSSHVSQDTLQKHEQPFPAQMAEKKLKCKFSNF